MSTLYMTQARLEMPVLIQLGRRLGLPLQTVDEGYLVHALLGELFGPQAPGPFSVLGMDGRYVKILAYGESSAAALEALAKATAAPELLNGVDWSTLETKPLPEVFPVSHKLAFDVRVTPVVRVHTPREHAKKGAEVDAFLLACWDQGKGVVVNRESVYVDWLKAALERQGGASCLGARMKGFSIARTVRRRAAEKGRVAQVVKRPVAELSGALEVKSSESFHQLIRQGVGRHKAFGLGMLQIRRL